MADSALITIAKLEFIFLKLFDLKKQSSGLTMDFPFAKIIISAAVVVVLGVVLSRLGLPGPITQFLREIGAGIVHELAEAEKTPAPQVNAPPIGTADEVAWLFIKDSAVVALFEEFVKKFPSSKHVPEAKSRIQELTKAASRSAVAHPPPAPPPDPCGELPNGGFANQSVSRLLEYARQCGKDGRYAAQANAALEAKLYEDATTCMRTTCAVDDCLSDYKSTSPTAVRLASLESQAERKKNTDSCQPYCAQRGAYEAVMRAGASAIKDYIRQCQSNGRYVEQAVAAFEAALFDDSLACLRSSCDFNSCVEEYAAQFPGRTDRLDDLRYWSGIFKQANQCVSVWTTKPVGR